MAGDPDGRDRNYIGGQASGTDDVESLQSDLELCHTFVVLAKTEYQKGDKAGVLQAQTVAELGYAAINGVVAKLEDPSHRHRIQTELSDLRLALDKVAARRNELNGSAGS